MDTRDSHRSNVPARLAGRRPQVPALARAEGGLPGGASPLSLRVVFRGARRYWWLVLMLTVVGSAGIGAGVYMKVKPNYRAISRLRVEPEAMDIYGIGKSSDSQLDIFLQTQVNLITSDKVLTDAGTSPKAARLARIQTTGDLIAELRKVITVNVVPGTYLIDVGMTSNSPQEAATLVNAVVDAFLASDREWSGGMSTTQIKLLEEYLIKLKTQSDELDRRWKDLAARGNDSQVVNRVTTPDGSSRTSEPSTRRSSMTLDQYQRVQQSLFDVNIELTQAEAWVTVLRGATRQAQQSPGPGADEARANQMAERRLKQDPEIVDLATQMMDARQRIVELTRKARDGSDPSIRLAREKLASLQGRYKDLYERKHREILAMAQSGSERGEAADPDRELREAENKLLTLRSKRDALKSQVEQLEVSTRKQGTDEVEIALIREQRESFRSMQETVNRRLEQLRFEARGQERIRLVNPAVAPGRPISDNRMKYMAMTPVGVLGTVLGLIVLLEIRSARVGDPDQLSNRVRHEVFSIAPLPDIRAGDDGTDEKAEQRLARFVQSLDHFRVALCEGGVPGEGRCVMITSASGGEGKTTLSAHLAARCANAGTSTLLIDADLRRASLGRLLDVPAGPGLGDVLAGEVGLEEATIAVQAGGFHFLSSGTPGRDPSQVLKSARLSELLGRLRQAYDLVIIDTPPILPVADALIVGRWTDGAVVAARFDASRLPLVERASRQLAAAGIPVLGVVINGARGRDQDYGNYNYNYSYPGRAEQAVGQQAPTA